MIEKYITPDKNEVIINLPNEYIGKKTLLHIDIIENNTKKPSDYFGTIDEETAKKFKKHLKKIKNNWE
jgi:hypothetical protein